MLIFQSGNNKLTKVIKALLFIALGVFLIATKANAMTMVLQVIAAGIFAVGVISFLAGMRFASAIPVNAIMNILIAVLLFSFAGPISTVLRYIIGGLLCLFGISQTLKMMSLGATLRGGFLPYIIPVFSLLLGALFFSEELIGNDIMGLVVAILFIMYGVSSLLATFKVYKLFMKKTDNVSRGPEKTSAKVGGGWFDVDDQNVKDVDYEKVD